MRCSDGLIIALTAHVQNITEPSRQNALCARCDVCGESARRFTLQLKYMHLLSDDLASYSN